MNGSDPSGLQYEGPDPETALAQGQATQQANQDQGTIVNVQRQRDPFAAYNQFENNGGACGYDASQCGPILLGSGDGGWPTPQTPTRNNVPTVVVVGRRVERHTVQDCLKQVAIEDGAGALLDIASIIPGGGDWADIARLGAGATSTVIAMTKNDNAGVALGGAGVGVAVTATATKDIVSTATGFAKDGLEAIPIVGSVVGVAAVGMMHIARPRIIMNAWLENKQ